MELLPAIDLIGGQVVRLFQGDYAQKETYGSEPAAFARQFEQAGATQLHLVDLDGAKAGKPCNGAAVRAITGGTGLAVELGGGMRSEESVEAAFAMGVQRVILGTSALKDPAFTRRMVQRYAQRISIGVDARDGKVAVEGWLATSETDSLAFCREMREIGVQNVIYTDISRDGAGRGTNLDIYEKLSQIEGLSITASGGVSSLGDIIALRELGVQAAIVGKALYTGAVELKAALAAAAGKEGVV